MIVAMNSTLMVSLRLVMPIWLFAKERKRTQMQTICALTSPMRKIIGKKKCKKLLKTNMKG